MVGSRSGLEGRLLEAKGGGREVFASGERRECSGELIKVLGEMPALLE